MKKIISFLVLYTFITMTITATSIRTLDTSYEDLLVDSIGLDSKKVSDEKWYFSTDGIDKTAKKMINELKKNPNDSEPVILYGISLGGTVARRMTQLAADEGLNVKGYIAQSSPLSGDRLTNMSWAMTSLSMLGAYSIMGLTTLTSGFLFANIVPMEQDYDFHSKLDEKTKAIIRCTENARNNKKIDRNNEQSVIENVTLPLLDLIFGSNENNRDDMTNYIKAVFSKENNVKDLDPVGNFMVNVMNTTESMEKEAANNIKRAFIESTNGNIYETALWNNVKPLLSYYQGMRDSYRAKATSQWWLYAYWLIRAAAIDVSIATIEGFPKAWSTCVSGSSNYSTNDGFVPADDTFRGKKLKMTAPNMRDYDLDRTYTCDKVSHVDYSEKNPNALTAKMGRTYCRIESLKQQQKALTSSIDFVKGKK